jgi:hypothetical protein
MDMLRIAALIALLGGLTAAACASDSNASKNPMAPSAVVATTLNDEATGGTSGVTAEGDTGMDDGDKGNKDDGDKGNKDDGDKGNKDDGDKGNKDGGDKGNKDDGEQGDGTSTGSSVTIQGAIGSIANTSITVNRQAVMVPKATVIRDGSRTVALSQLRVGDRVRVTATLKGAALEASEITLQR